MRESNLSGICVLLVNGSIEYITWILLEGNKYQYVFNVRLKSSKLYGRPKVDFVKGLFKV